MPKGTIVRPPKADGEVLVAQLDENPIPIIPIYIYIFIRRLTKIATNLHLQDNLGPQWVELCENNGFRTSPHPALVPPVGAELVAEANANADWVSKTHPPE